MHRWSADDQKELVAGAGNRKGYAVGDVYVQAGVGPAGGRMYVVISGVAMPFDDARALDRGVVTLDEIAAHRTA